MNRYEMEPILNPAGRFVIYGDAMHTIEKLEAQVEDLKSAGRTARDDATSALDLLSRVRFALGDHGTRMQGELVDYCRELAGMPEQVRALEELSEAKDVLNGQLTARVARLEWFICHCGGLGNEWAKSCPFGTKLTDHIHGELNAFLKRNP